MHAACADNAIILGLTAEVQHNIAAAAAGGGEFDHLVSTGDGTPSVTAAVAVGDEFHGEGSANVVARIFVHKTLFYALVFLLCVRSATMPTRHHRMAHKPCSTTTIS